MKTQKKKNQINHCDNKEECSCLILPTLPARVKENHQLNLVGPSQRHSTKTQPTCESFTTSPRLSLKACCVSVTYAFNALSILWRWKTNKRMRSFLCLLEEIIFSLLEEIRYLGRLEPPWFRNANNKWFQRGQGGLICFYTFCSISKDYIYN